MHTAPTRTGPRPANEDALRLLHKIQGQVTGLIRMVEAERYCIDILTPFTAARAALNGVGRSLMKRHLDHCVTDAMRGGDDATPSIVDELMTVLRRAHF